MPFGNVLRGLRIRRDLTQKELADALGVSESTIGMYERGKREPNFEALEVIADYFNVDIEFLIGKTDIERRIAFSSKTGEKWEAPSAPSSLDETLLRSFHQLNEDGQQKVVSYAEDLVSSGKYEQASPRKVV